MSIRIVFPAKEAATITPNRVFTVLDRTEEDFFRRITVINFLMSIEISLFRDQLWAFVALELWIVDFDMSSTKV